MTVFEFDKGLRPLYSIKLLHSKNEPKKLASSMGIRNKPRPLINKYFSIVADVAENFGCFAARCWMTLMAGKFKLLSCAHYITLSPDMAIPGHAMH